MAGTQKAKNQGAAASINARNQQDLQAEQEAAGQALDMPSQAGAGPAAVDLLIRLPEATPRETRHAVAELKATADNFERALKRFTLDPQLKDAVDAMLTEVRTGAEALNG